MTEEKAIIIGGGPCGLSAAIHLKQIGVNALVIEKGNVVNSIYNYPTHQTFSVQVKNWKSAMSPLLRKTENRSEYRLSLTTERLSEEKSRA